MKTLIEDIEIIKKRISHLKKLATRGGGQDLEQILAEINLLKTDILTLQENNKNQDQQLLVVVQEIDGLTSALQENESKVEKVQSEANALAVSCENLQRGIAQNAALLGQHQNDLNSQSSSLQDHSSKIAACQATGATLNDKVNNLQTENNTQGTNISDLQSRTSTLESLVSSLGGGGDILGNYASFAKGYNNAGTGYAEFKVSSNKMLRVFFGIKKVDSLLNFDKPFDEVLWAITVPCPTGQTLTGHVCTIASISTTAMSFVGGSVFCRFEVWGFVSV